MLDVQRLKGDFPIFTHHQELVYLDNAATSHKPQVVIEALSNFYSQANANVHRGIYALSEQASEAYEAARQRLATFVGAASSQEIVFTSGATAALNLVANAYAAPRLSTGDEVVVADFEHHSNFLPWQRLCQQTGATLRVVASDEAGQISLEQWQAVLSERTKLVALAHASNVTGSVQDIAAVANLVHQVGAVLVVDGAQAAPHLAVDVRALDCDFYVLAGHKMLGPMGIGVLYAKAAHLAAMQPDQVGGGMIEAVTVEEVTFAPPPQRFEAGTPHVAGAIALAAAADYLTDIGLDAIHAHEVQLSEYLLGKLSELPRLRLLGQATAEQRTGLVTFNVAGVHAHDLADYLAQQQIAVRAGFHCAMPLHQAHQCQATLRASYYLYNDQQDLDRLVAELIKAIAYYG